MICGLDLLMLARYSFSNIYSSDKIQQMTSPRIKLSKKDQTNIGITAENIRELIEGENTGLTCSSISDSYTIKQLVIDLSGDFLQKKEAI